MVQTFQKTLYLNLICNIKNVINYFFKKLINFDLSLTYF